MFANEFMKGARISVSLRGIQIELEAEVRWLEAKFLIEMVGFGPPHITHKLHDPAPSPMRYK